MAMKRKTFLVLAFLLALGLGGFAGIADAGTETEESATEMPKPTWDRVANIKDAAERLGQLQRTRGVKAAYMFIDACYRTHGLAENYGEAFEACIAQDYIETKILAQIYARMPPETLEKLGAPSPVALADAMGRRIVAAFSQYKVPAAYGQELKTLVDTHGVPVFIKIVFPETVKELEEKTPKGTKKKKS